jgi:hypothetical protein
MVNPSTFFRISEAESCQIRDLTPRKKIPLSSPFIKGRIEGDYNLTGDPTIWVREFFPAFGSTSFGFAQDKPLTINGGIATRPTS